MDRREYKIDRIYVNNIAIDVVIIDSHYEIKHSSYMNDELILLLVRELDGRLELPEYTDGKYKYYSSLVFNGTKKYRLVWLLEDTKLYIGIINAYRDRRRN